MMFPRFKGFNRERKKRHYKQGLTKRKLKSFVREEKEASKMYRGYGFKSQAKDEAEHSRFFAKLLRRKEKGMR